LLPSIANKMAIRIVLLLLISLPGLVVADPLSCRVVTISEGDTFNCLTIENQRLRVRLAEIDAPEIKQPYGAGAKQALSELILEKQVILHVQEVDRFGRTLARAYVGAPDVNYTLVEQGNAWAYTKQLKDHRLKDAETLAKHGQRPLASFRRINSRLLGLALRRQKFSAAKTQAKQNCNVFPVC
jgi:micrococcal nuclease